MGGPVPPFTPKLAFVTGATSGIGRATARAFAAQSVSLLLLGRRGDRLEALRKEFPQVEATTWTCDVRDPVALAAGAVRNRELLERVDVVVNNAGLALGRDPLHETRPDDWDTMIDTNIKGVLRTTQLVLPHMVKRGHGHVINLGSITGRQVYKGGTVYAATKFAVRGLTESLRHDLLGTGVRVTSIDPGLVETEFSLVRHGDPEAARKVYANMRTLKPEDVADAIVFCATRPPHVDIAELLIMPTDQASVTLTHRTG